MPRCSTSILLHSAGGALERPTARTRYTYITYHTTLHYIPHDENTAAGRPRAGGRRRGTRWPAIGGGALVTTKNKRSNQKQINSQNAPALHIPFSFCILTAPAHRGQQFGSRRRPER